MKLESTNKNSEEVSFEEALLQGLAPDKGLYFPTMIPSISKEELQSLKGKGYAEIAFIIASKFLDGEVDEESIRHITTNAYNFEVPLEHITTEDYLMRLDKGPTASFKDFAARMMARLMQYFMQRQERELFILTATSGDTGSAVAQAFHGLDNIRVAVLFPRDEVSDRQRKQMTTLGDNVTAIAVEGKFDDCQAMVKQAFVDPELKDLGLSSANSINFGRLLPQTVYYFWAFSQLNTEKIIFSVPSGNFGDLMGGLIAKKMGLPVERFIAAVNENDEVATFINTGNYEKIIPSKNCLSNAMNVGHPSNLSRLVALYGGQMDETGAIIKEPDMQQIRRDIFAISVTDQQTKNTIKETYEKYKTIVEPHGAVGWNALNQYKKQNPTKTLSVTLETADPAKFPDEIIRLTGVEPPLPESLRKVEMLEENMQNIKNDYEVLKALLLRFS